jgi:hypothetical protein
MDDRTSVTADTALGEHQGTAAGATAEIEHAQPLQWAQMLDPAAQIATEPLGTRTGVVAPPPLVVLLEHRLDLLRLAPHVALEHAVEVDREPGVQSLGNEGLCVHGVPGVRIVSTRPSAVEDYIWEQLA